VSFKTDAAGREPINRIIDNLYLGLTANAVRSRLALQELRTDVPTGFDPRTGRPKRNTSTASRYVQVATNMGNIRTTAFARAVHFVARKRFATSLSYSKKGQRVDMLIGNFLESF
jgi:hypothetical protein